MSPVAWRRLPRSGDVGAVGRLVEATGFFNRAEAAVARELVAERLAKGLSSGYRFWLAEHRHGLAGYACYGPVAGAAGSWELYWIAVAPPWQGRGLGGRIISRVAACVMRGGGRRLYAETSSRGQYRPTRAFYLAAGFEEQARLDGFYGPGDDKVIYRLKV